jgi:hypothetical protein
VKITILVEGQTESVFKKHLNIFLKTRLAGRMPQLAFMRHDGGIPTREKLKRVVLNLLNDRPQPSDAVIALTDVYPAFKSAADVKQKMREWVGEEQRFYPHVALHDFEAWLLPYWPKIQKLSGCAQNAPGSNPETVNHNNPPAHRLAEVFQRGGKCDYIKPRDAGRILEGEDLMLAINACAELKAFVNRILGLCSAQLIS